MSRLLCFLSSISVSPQTVPEELQNGRGFGYVVAFRPHGKMIWMLTVLASADASRYVFRNESVRPFSPFEVKVGVFNNKGEGPFSPTTLVYSAEEGRGHASLIFLQLSRGVPFLDYKILIKQKHIQVYYKSIDTL